jgi:IS1 family transposase
VSAVEYVPVSHIPIAMDERSPLSNVQDLNIPNYGLWLQGNKKFIRCAGICGDNSDKGNTAASRVVYCDVPIRLQKRHRSLFNESHSWANVIEVTSDSDYRICDHGNISGDYLNPGTFFTNQKFHILVGSFNGTPSFYRLPADYEECEKCSKDEKSCIVCELPLYCYIFVALIFGGLSIYGLALFENRRYVRGLGCFFAGSCGFLSTLTSFAFCDPLFWRAEWLALTEKGNPYRCEHKRKTRDSQDAPPHGISVTQKYVLTTGDLCITLIAIGRQHMANILSTDKQIAVIGALAEGSSIRSIERITGVHRDTIMRLGVRVGQGCAKVLDVEMRNLSCQQLQFDEIWGFIGKKERHCTPDDSLELGDVWTFCAIDPETKLVPSFKCGKRDLPTANAFVADVASRMRNRVQISSDALRAYVEAVEMNFGADVDFAQIIKTYITDDSHIPERRFSAPEIVVTEKKSVSGFPDLRLASTSHVERLNGTTRLHMRRLTRLTYAFSKKLDNFKAAVALHFAYYNFVKRHNTLRATPAMAAGIARDFWTVGHLIEAAA